MRNVFCVDLWQLRSREESPRATIEGSMFSAEVMSSDHRLWALSLVDEDLRQILAIVSAIPEGVRLAEFPVHCEGAECWCRPRIAYVPGEILVDHKNLANGEFDS